MHESSSPEALIATLFPDDVEFILDLGRLDPGTLQAARLLQMETIRTHEDRVRPRRIRVRRFEDRQPKKGKGSRRRHLARIRRIRERLDRPIALERSAEALIAFAWMAAGLRGTGEKCEPAVIIDKARRYVIQKTA